MHYLFKSFNLAALMMLFQFLLIIDVCLNRDESFKQHLRGESPFFSITQCYVYVQKSFISLDMADVGLLG